MKAFRDWEDLVGGDPAATAMRDGGKSGETKSKEKQRGMEMQKDELEEEKVVSFPPVLDNQGQCGHRARGGAC